MGKGLNTKSGRMLQMIRQGANPNVIDTTGVRVVTSNMDHDYAESYEFENRRRRGVNGGYFNAVTDGMAEGQLEGVLCYNMMDDQVLPYILAKCVDTDDVVTGGVRERVYYWPQYDRADRAFFAVQEGRDGSVLQGGFGMFTSFKWVSKTGKKSSATATLPFITQAPTNIAEMTGATPQNGKFRLVASNVSGDVTLGIVAGSMAKKSVTIPIGFTKAQIEAAFAAQGLTVVSAGTVTVGAGERHFVSGSGNALSIYGIDVFSLDPGDAQDGLENAIRAINPALDSLAGDITFRNAGLVSNFHVESAMQLQYTADYFAGAAHLGAPTFANQGGSNVFFWNGTNWRAGGSVSAPDAQMTGGTNINDPFGGWSASGVTFSDILATGAAPASANLTITYDVVEGNVTDLTFEGAGYTGQSIQPGGAGGVISFEVTAPTQTRVVVTREAGVAGYVVTTHQQGGKGIAAAIVEPMPILPGHLRFYYSDTLDGLDAPAAYIGRISEAELEIPKLAEPAHFHNNTESGPITYSAHKEPEDLDIMLSVTLPTDENGDCAGLTDGTLDYVSKSGYWRIKAVCPAPFVGHEQHIEFYGSVGKSIPLTYNENVEERKFIFNLMENRVTGWNFRWKSRVAA